MLQSIQFNGSGPPTYAYSQKAVGATGEFYHVFATETSGYDGRKDEGNGKPKSTKEDMEGEVAENEEFKVIDNRMPENLQEFYQKEYGRRESFLWKQR